MSEEVAQAAADLATVEHWRLRALSAEATAAALVEACLMFAEFVESYDRNSALAQGYPTFYGLLRVYGKNARAALQMAVSQREAAARVAGRAK